MAVSPDDLKSITEAARDLAYFQLNLQLQASDNLDANALGVLAFDGAGLAAILAAKDLFNGRWAIPAALVLLSSASAIITMRRFPWDLGPDPRQFYDNAVREGAPVGSAATANVDLVSEFAGASGSISRNEALLRRKSWSFIGALGIAALAGMAGAILVAIPR